MRATTIQVQLLVQLRQGCQSWLCQTFIALACEYEGKINSSITRAEHTHFPSPFRLKMKMTTSICMVQHLKWMHHPRGMEHPSTILTLQLTQRIPKFSQHDRQPVQSLCSRNRRLDLHFLSQILLLGICQNYRHL